MGGRWRRSSLRARSRWWRATNSWRSPKWWRGWRSRWWCWRSEGTWYVVRGTSSNREGRDDAPRSKYHAPSTMKPPFPIAEHGTVVTVGTFDGIHLGHRAVLQEIAQRAQ